MTRKSRKLRSSFCEVDCTAGWSLIKGFISRKLSVIGMKVSFRNFARQFISYCVLIQKS